MDDSVEFVEDFGEDEPEGVREVFLEFQKVVLVFLGRLDFLYHWQEVAKKGQIHFVETVDFALQKFVYYLLTTTENVTVLFDCERMDDQRVPKRQFRQDEIEVSRRVALIFLGD